MDTYDLEYVPLRIFVVWNPAFEYGFGLARELYEWFGGPNRTWHRSGLGIPVLFWTTEHPNDIPPPVPTSTQTFTVVVPLETDFAGGLAWLAGWRNAGPRLTRSASGPSIPQRSRSNR